MSKQNELEFQSDTIEEVHDMLDGKSLLNFESTRDWLVEGMLGAEDGAINALFKAKHAEEPTPKKFRLTPFENSLIVEWEVEL